MSFLPRYGSWFLSCVWQNRPQREGSALSHRHISAERAVIWITLRSVSPFIPVSGRASRAFAGNLHVRLCVQRRLACSAGERPAGARVRSPVVWIAGWRETKTLKPIDNVSLGKATSHRAVTTVNAKVASKVRSPEGRVLNRRAKAAWGSRNLTDAAPSLRRGGSDSTVARTCRATGEALLVPARNRRSRVDRITGSTGKSIEGERVTDGFAVAVRRGNARGAKEPCCL